MKSIVRMTVAAAVLLFSAGSLAAQGPDGQKMTPEQRADENDSAHDRTTVAFGRAGPADRADSARSFQGNASGAAASRRRAVGSAFGQAFRSRRRAAAGNGRADQVRADRCPIPKMDRDASRYENPARLLAWTQTGARKARPTDLRFGLSLCGGRFGLIVSCGRLSVSGSEVRSPCGGGGKQSAFLHDRAKKSCRERFSRHVRPWLLAPVAVVWASFRESPFGMSALRPYRR